MPCKEKDESVFNIIFTIFVVVAIIASLIYTVADSSTTGNECLAKAKQYENEGNQTKANSLYQKVCDLNEGTGCTILGYNYKYGLGLSKDINKANYLFQKACKLGYKNSCNRSKK